LSKSLQGQIITQHIITRQITRKWQYRYSDCCYYCHN